MEKNKFFLIVLIFIFLANGLLSQNRSFPYEINKKDLWLLPLGIVLSEYGDYLSDNFDLITYDEVSRLDRNDVNAFDRSATYNWSLKWDERSDQYRDILVLSTLLAISIPPVFHAKLSETVTVAGMLVESYFLLKGVTYLTKTTVGRERPYLYNTSMSIDERYFMGGEDASFSFFSGHTAAAFTAATFLSKIMTDIHGHSVWTKLLWGSSLTLAALTGYARYEAGMHFPSDVIAGAAVGFAIGYLIPTLHKKNKNKPVSLSISPDRISLRLGF